MYELAGKSPAYLIFAHSFPRPQFLQFCSGEILRRFHYLPFLRGRQWVRCRWNERFIDESINRWTCLWIIHSSFGRIKRSVTNDKFFRAIHFLLPFQSLKDDSEKCCLFYTIIFARISFWGHRTIESTGIFEFSPLLRWMMGNMSVLGVSVCTCVCVCDKYVHMLWQ